VVGVDAAHRGPGTDLGDPRDCGEVAETTGERRPKRHPWSPKTSAVTASSATYSERTSKAVLVHRPGCMRSAPARSGPRIWMWPVQFGASQTHTCPTGQAPGAGEGVGTSCARAGPAVTTTRAVARPTRHGRPAQPAARDASRSSKLPAFLMPPLSPLMPGPSADEPVPVKTGPAVHPHRRVPRGAPFRARWSRATRSVSASAPGSWPPPFPRPAVLSWRTPWRPGGLDEVDRGPCGQLGARSRLWTPISASAPRPAGPAHAPAALAMTPHFGKLLPLLQWILMPSQLCNWHRACCTGARRRGCGLVPKARTWALGPR
jgi:hypothetical protein